MNWEEQLKGITIGTLFKFIGKLTVASIVWAFVIFWVMMAVIMVPMYFIMEAIAPY